MPAKTPNLFLLEDLEEASRTKELAESDRNALRSVADWTNTFVTKPHKDLGRPGPVCPFVPDELRRLPWRTTHKLVRSAPETWARRAYEVDRGGHFAAPETAGALLRRDTRRLQITSAAD